MTTTPDPDGAIDYCFAIRNGGDLYHVEEDAEVGDGILAGQCDGCGNSKSFVVTAVAPNGTRRPTQATCSPAVTDDIYERGGCGATFDVVWARSSEVIF